ncbi:hypothetical protein [Paracoccus siganidrum]|uniref:hypothetical protein n=1 Tax=Paracoccus siganidrum TaxID=1276757 RepID=UPI00197F7F5D|nr:hypothetical protein [Paracoccus siganidrum]
MPAEKVDIMNLDDGDSRDIAIFCPATHHALRPAAITLPPGMRWAISSFTPMQVASGEDQSSSSSFGHSDF